MGHHRSPIDHRQSSSTSGRRHLSSAVVAVGCRCLLPPSTTADCRCRRCRLLPVAADRRPLSPIATADHQLSPPPTVGHRRRRPSTAVVADRRPPPAVDRRQSLTAYRCCHRRRRSLTAYCCCRQPLLPPPSTVRHLCRRSPTSTSADRHRRRPSPPQPSTIASPVGGRSHRRSSLAISIDAAASG